MRQRINTPISVSTYFNHKTHVVEPTSILWEGRCYKVRKVGFRHKFREGRNLYHVFSVLAGTIFFRLVLDTETLFWRVEEVADGIPD